MKEILIINGSGGVGKDTFVEKLSRYANVIHTSIVNPVKEMAKHIGWSGDKTEKSRKFLFDLKNLVDEYNDYNYIQAANLMKGFRDGKLLGDLLCIDMREAKQIQRAQKEFGARTVLVVRDSVKHITSNIADKGVYNIEYDYVIKNNGTLYDLDQEAKRFVLELSKPKYRKTIFVSHPYGNSEKNKKRLEKIVGMLENSFSEYLFVTGVHSFGYGHSSYDYSAVIKKCLWLLNKCDEAWFFGNIKSSQGCLEELAYCKNHQIPYTLAEEGGSVINECH